MFSVKKNWQLQLQVSNICHINNMFRTRCLSLMYSWRKRNLDTSKTKENIASKQGIKFHIPLSLPSVGRVQ